MGVVAEQLERTLSQEIQSHGVFVWLDPKAVAAPFAEALARKATEGRFPYPVVLFDGSFLGTMVNLEPHLAGEVVYVLLYAPRLDEATVRRSPLLEVWLAAKESRFSLEAVIREAARAHIAPADLDAWLATWDGTLDAADRWVTERATSDPRVLRLLEHSTPTDVALDILLAGPLLKSHGLAPSDLVHWLSHTFGLPETPVGDLPGRLAEHLLLVEYVHDLGSIMPSEALAHLRAVPAPIVQSCRRTVEKLRTQSPEDYERLALDVEEAHPGEREWAKDKDLGRVDTFRFEDRVLASQALVLLGGTRWPNALAVAERRLGLDGSAGSFWVGREPRRRQLWEWIREAARLGVLIEGGRKAPAWDSLREVVEGYTVTYSEIDRSHRRFEQLDARLRGLSEIEEFPRTRPVLRLVREQVRSLLDSQAEWFAAVCERKGALPPPDLQLRGLFEEEILPRVAPGEPLVLFVVDALRYELAAELKDALGALPEGAAVLKARLAELPTETAVGMNVIPPVTRTGRLVPVWREGDIIGFRAGEFSVTSIEGRRKAIAGWVSGTTVPWLRLDEVIAQEPDALRKKLKDARVVVVHSREIDEAGHAGLGIDHFDTLVGQLAAAWHRLNAAGARTFVFTADHGFLLGDETALAEAGHLPSEGVYAAFSGRYALRDDPERRPGWLSIPLASLQYDVESGRPSWLLLPRHTRVVYVRPTGSNQVRQGPIPVFVHGGNSLQERVVPVLIVSRAPARTLPDLGRKLEVTARQAVFGAQKMAIAVKDEGSGTLEFMRNEVDLALRVPDHPEISVVVGDVEGGERLSAAVIRVRVGAEPATVFFQLQGPEDGIARVEVRAISEVIRPITLGWPVPVMGRGPAPTEPREDSPAKSKAAGSPWHESLPPEFAPFAAALRHLDTHQTLAEDALVEMLGGAPMGVRMARQLSRLLADPAKRAFLPFDIRIHDAGGRKEYVRETRK